EEAGVPDVVCSFMETVTAIVLAAMLLRRRGPRRHRGWVTRVAIAPVALLVALLTLVGSAAGAAAMPVAFKAAPAVPGEPSIPVTALTEAPGPQPVDRFTLTAEVRRIGGHEAWTFNGTVPGPELRVRQGDRVEVTLVNHLPAPTTVHWHGVPGLPDAEDGVAGLTQDAVPPGGRFVYDFVAREPGTYWYHTHQDTGGQLPLGLFGALVVEPRGGVAQARDHTVVLHQDGAAVAMNGVTGTLRLAARPGETVRLRLIDAVVPQMDGTPETPVLIGASYRVVALDGRDLDAPGLLGPERLVLGMGQRADLVFTMPMSGAVRLVDGEEHGKPSLLQRLFGGPTARFASALIGDGPAPAVPDLGRLPVFDPLHYGAPALDPITTHPADVTFPIVIDEAPGFRDGTIQLVHTIDGEAAPYVPPITVHEGELVRLHIVNRSGEYHPMHLHGHTMSAVARDGVPVRGSPIHLDTLLVGPHQTWDVVFLADNPGLWMLHCHVLLHARMGMSMTVDYAGVTTPFTMGSRSGNIPE
ncbi:MAG TPA: multicopper oxidase family protein, partial [Acidimicrobiales bacterium]|nr:multicopper oxidase family protein [Acidimicrobiales bacterium]